jgi:hypothetical protein
VDKLAEPGRSNSDLPIQAGMIHANELLILMASSSGCPPGLRRHRSASRRTTSRLACCNRVCCAARVQPLTVEARTPRKRTPWPRRLHPRSKWFASTWRLRFDWSTCSAGPICWRRIFPPGCRGRTITSWSIHSGCCSRKSPRHPWSRSMPRARSSVPRPIPSTRPLLSSTARSTWRAPRRLASYTRIRRPARRWRPRSAACCR